MNKKTLFFLISFIIFCILYFLRIQVILKTEYIPKQSYLIKGRVTSINKLSATKWRVKISHFRADLGQKPQFQLGDQVQATGRLEKRVIGSFYPEFWLINPEIKKFESPAFSASLVDTLIWPLLRKINHFRSLLEKIGNRVMVSPQSALLLGIVLGSKQQLSAGFYEQLRQSGTLHIVVASGMNVTILAKVILSGLLKRFKRGLAVSVSLFCILLYTILAGGEPPIVRAALMGSLAFTAQVFGRQYWAGWALFLAAGLMVLVTPGQLFEVGFQLSVAATAGLLFISPWLTVQIEEGIDWLKRHCSLASKLVNLIKTDLTETTSAQLAVLPLLMTYFGQFNLLAVIPNVLVGFLVPIVMRWGGGLFLLGFIWERLAMLVGWIVWVPLTYMVAVIRFFSQIDWLVIRGEWAWWVVGGYWLCLAFLVRNNQKKLSS